MTVHCCENGSRQATDTIYVVDDHRQYLRIMRAAAVLSSNGLSNVFGRARIYHDKEIWKVAVFSVPANLSQAFIRFLNSQLKITPQTHRGRFTDFLNGHK